MQVLKSKRQMLHGIYCRYSFIFCVSCIQGILSKQGAENRHNVLLLPAYDSSFLIAIVNKQHDF
jgi:hypothetical protein